MRAEAGKEIRENPLVPHAVLQRMYEGMLRLRKAGARTPAGERRRVGEEACRASSLLSLGGGDLLSDVPGSERLRRAWKGMGETSGEPMRWLPDATDADERLGMALGAAMALRVQGQGRLLLAYLDADELGPAQWKRVLRVAGERQLPMIFLLLPTAATGGQGTVSDRAQGWGVPGMPVDAADPVALYRVMQESVMRARSGDGPALLEGVQWRPKGGIAEPADGVQAMRKLLRSRGLLPAGR